MTKRWIASTFLCTGFLFACDGGGSGVSGNKKVIDLSPAEIASVCDYVVATFPQRTVTCSGQSQTTGATKADCVSTNPTKEANPLCTATVSQTEACADALGDLSDAQVCTLEEPPAACVPLFTDECN